MPFVSIVPIIAFSLSIVTEFLLLLIGVDGDLLCKVKKEDTKREMS